MVERLVDIYALRVLAPLLRAPVPRSSAPQARTPPPAGAAGAAQAISRSSSARVGPYGGGASFFPATSMTRSAKPGLANTALGRVRQLAISRNARKMSAS